jgi:3alpha(or 20beta)-hydroxysteroid dehydrogenase
MAEGGVLEGRVALVTGGSRGQGEAEARALATEGAKVVIADILDDEGADVAADIGSAARYRHLDVTSESEWDDAVAFVLAEFGGLDVLVNNAGILMQKRLVDTTVEEYNRVVSVNQLGPFLGIKSVALAMESAGGGSIVNVSSVDGLSAKNGLAAYASTKWGVRGLTRVAALELGQRGIRVNAVCPEAGGPGMRRPFTPENIDPMDTLAFTHDVIPHNQKRPGAEIILDIARMILFLASDESLSCTGADYAVDAGWTAGRRLRFNPGYSVD